MKTDKDLYRQLRALSCDQLWLEEVPKFDRAAAKERAERVAVIRAVGVAFAGSGTAAQKTAVRAWLLALLQDPGEKVRRYAMAAMPKLGADPQAEAGLLALWQKTTAERERKYLSQALEKIGGAAALAAVPGVARFQARTEQKLRASVARADRPSIIKLNVTLAEAPRLRIHLRCRRGLEELVRGEVQDYIAQKGPVRIADVRSGLVALAPTGPLSLNDLYKLRCFGTLGFVLGTVNATPQESIEAWAAAITSPMARYLMATLTVGASRYRLEFISRGHQRGAVRAVATRAYARCPDILNDARRAPWAIDIHPARPGTSVELRPRLSPDPRLFYRQDDVPASSHPPLAACMARLAGRVEGDIVWDPFCGSGLELVECALRGGVRDVYGTDLSAEAIAIAQANLAAAKLPSVRATFACRDFREYAKVAGLGPASVSLIITNPPMGRRIRIPDMRRLFTDFFAVAAAALKPGGRLVFANPLRLEPADPALKLEYRQVVDLGGFDCRLELYRKLAR